MSSKHGLAYLTSNDWALVTDKASRIRFHPGDVMVLTGQRAGGVYLLLKGNARVQIASQPGKRSIGPGEICGEMSFLEDAPASASVFAEEDVEAFHLDRPTLEGFVRVVSPSRLALLPVVGYKFVPAFEGDDGWNPVRRNPRRRMR